jgi:DNA-directed RNA polymerase specialized sigma24 family protein
VSLNGPAAARLYDEHVDAIYAYAARRVGPRAAVEVVEDVFEHALRQDAQRPAHTGTDLGWLLAMATAFLRRHSETECRRLRDWQPPTRSTSQAIPRVTDPLLANTVEDGGTITTARVMAAIAELDPVERDLLFLIAWEGCSSSLTAVATGVPQNEVRSRLSAVRKEIRRRVAVSTSQMAEPTDADVAEAAGDTTPDGAPS